MVGHQHVGVNLHRVMLRGGAERIEVEAVVRFGEEARLPVVAALHDVQQVAGNGEAGAAGTWQAQKAPTLSALPIFRRSTGWTKAGYYSSDPMKPTQSG